MKINIKLNAASALSRSQSSSPAVQYATDKPEVETELRQFDVVQDLNDPSYIGHVTKFVGKSVLVRDGSRLRQTLISSVKLIKKEQQ